MSELEQIIKNLKGKENVDAVLIVGSQSRDEGKSYSDIDIAIILKENSQNLQSLFQWVDGKPCDIFFFDGAMLSMITSSKFIPANRMDAVLINWLSDAKIEFDKSGIITSLKEASQDLNKKLEVPLEEMITFESKINAGYVVNKRYFVSGNETYFEALQIKLLQDTYNIFIGYFEFRGIPWRGEKVMLQYLKDNDIEFYALLMQCTKASAINEKFEAYEKLVKSVFHGDYHLWSKEIIRPYINHPINKARQEELVEYWKKLINSE